jgi:hypothetical protein
LTRGPPSHPAGPHLKPKHLLLAPPLVWSAAGIILLVDGRHALDYFPYLWPANDLAMMAAFAGLMLTLFSGGDERPAVSEWSGLRPRPDEAPPLEEMLVELAERLEREAPVL